LANLLQQVIDTLTQGAGQDLGTAFDPAKIFFVEKENVDPRATAQGQQHHNADAQGYLGTYASSPRFHKVSPFRLYDNKARVNFTRLI
jgi:hypothetical protein